MLRSVGGLNLPTRASAGHFEQPGIGRRDTDTRARKVLQTGIVQFDGRGRRAVPIAPEKWTPPWQVKHDDGRL